MAVKVESAQVLLSGGAANTNPNASLGGPISSTDIAGGIATLDPSPAGLSVDFVTVSKEGPSTLTIQGQNSANPFFKAWWSPPGEYGFGFSEGFDSVPTTDYGVLRGSGDSLSVLAITVNNAVFTYPAQDEIVNYTVQVDPTPENLFADITPTEATDGSVVYRCLYFKHNPNYFSQQTFPRLKIWIESQFPGGSYLSIAFDPVAKSGEALTLVDESDSTNVLAGLTFVEPTDISTALLYGAGDYLTENEYVALWVRRTVVAGEYSSSSLVTSSLAHYFGSV
jgi:hypothetical protein